ncbi:MAG TPA: exodeoxyribonuclease VII large subunit [Chloroflexota bacterium]
MSISRFAPYQHTAHVYEVAELSEYIGSVLEADPVLEDVWLRGEVTNVSRSPAGHHYFNLRDDTASLRCVLFRGSAFNSPVMPANGLALVAHGSVRFYPRYGSCELLADLLFPEGVSVSQLQSEMLYRRLESEGLFELSRKRALPSLPQRIGVVSSERGAVIHDLLTVLARRFPLTEVVFLPSPVQGLGAAAAMVRALHRLSTWRRDGRGVDVIVLARGGGSDEDLAAFNDERLARAIFAAPVPLVSAVGHETNLTLADLVADLRAPTPSAAAELLTPDIVGLRRELSAVRGRMSSAVARRLERSRQAATFASERLSRRVHAHLVGAADRVDASAARLRALSPANTLARGYAIVRDGDRIVRDAATVSPGDSLRVQLQHGHLTSTVQAVEPQT